MKISVIVPVYNAERYLDKLVQSVLSQTYEDYELILVDDSSKDNSYLLMKKYQEMDSRIKAYTKENTGPGLTRKFGFEKSSGDLFFFVDSDDWVTTSDVFREINDLFEKNENIVARKIHDTFFLINITDKYENDKCILYQINEIGFFIWNNIDGKNSSNDLADLIKSAINDEVDYQTILSDVSEFLSELNNNGFIKKTPVSAL